MDDAESIVNKVAGSGLVLLEMDNLISSIPIVAFDIAPQLWQGLVLKELDFRAYIDSFGWHSLRNHSVAVYCSTDAIIPHWAYMLIGSKLSAVDVHVYFGTPAEFRKFQLLDSIDKLDLEHFRNQRVILKGCGKGDADYSAYGYLAFKLSTVVKSLMFGEPCSNVPVFKKK